MISILPEHAPGALYESYEVVVEDYVFYTIDRDQFDEKVQSIAQDISDQLTIFSYLFDETKIVKEVIQQLRVRTPGPGGKVHEKMTERLLKCIYDIFCK